MDFLFVLLAAFLGIVIFFQMLRLLAYALTTLVLLALIGM